MRKSEQETTITHIRNDEYVYIYSSNPVDLRKLRNDPRVVETSPGVKSWGKFRIARTDFSPVGGFRRRRRVLTEEQREVLAARLAASRAVS